jgi:hypothetical protein
MVFSKMQFQTVVINEVLWPPALVSPVAYVALFMTIPTMSEQLIVSIEALSAEAAFWVSLEPSLIHSAWVIVAKSLMFLQFLLREKLVLMREGLLVSCAQVAHNLVVYASNVAMQVWPAQACHCTLSIRTIVPQKEYRVFKYLLLLVLYAQRRISSTEIAVFKLLIPLLWFVRKDDKIRVRSAM